MKKSFQELYDAWNSLLKECRMLPNAKEVFATQRDKLIAESGWTKLEFYDAIDEYWYNLYGKNNNQ